MTHREMKIKLRSLECKLERNVRKYAIPGMVKIISRKEI